MAYKKKTSYAAKRSKKPGLFAKMKTRLADLFRREAKKPPVGVAGMRPAGRRGLGVTPARLGAAVACMMLGLVVWAGYQFASHWTLFHLNANEIKLIGAHTLTERQVLALAGLIGYVLYLRKHDGEEGYDVPREDSPSQKLRKLFSRKDRDDR